MSILVTPTLRTTPPVWNYTSIEAQPDVHVATLNRVPLKNGAGKGLFGVNNLGPQDAPAVQLTAWCMYLQNGTNALGEHLAASSLTGYTVAVPKGGDYLAEWVTCQAVAGQHLSSISLHAAVELPFVDSDTSNNEGLGTFGEGS